jgi:hypothetical protein
MSLLPLTLTTSLLSCFLIKWNENRHLLHFIYSRVLSSFLFSMFQTVEPSGQELKRANLMIEGHALLFGYFKQGKITLSGFRTYL